MKHLGLRDIPVEILDDECLGIMPYVDSLSEFIQQCETPLTIALQGDWGSGKTSMMNLIMSNITATDKNIKTIWFNTWQYSQFGMQDDLAISLITHFVDELGNDNDKTVQKIASWLWKGVKAGVVVTASVAGQGEAGERVVKQFEHGSSDPAKQIKELKEELRKLVDRKNNEEHYDRVVVFVDDLDRLLPERAVELLEVFKLFLDIPGVVYVLACDYHVVTQGLIKKFGVGANDLKGKSFFDKIIQLPFNMPVAQYDVTNYFERLLRRIGVEYESADIKQYTDMVSWSVGFNPRSMKRLFNSLQLLNIVANRNNMFTNDGSEALKSEKQKTIFGCLCLQTAYEPMYRYIQKNMHNIDQHFFNFLIDKDMLTTQDGVSDEIRKEINDTYDEIKKDLNDVDGKKMKSLSEFMKVFFESIQLRSDNDKEALSEGEIMNLKQILSFSSLTSTDSGPTIADIDYEERAQNRDIGKDLVVELNNKFTKYIDEIKYPFKLYQGRQGSRIYIYIWPKIQECEFSLEFSFDKDSMFLCSCSSKQLSRDFGINWFNTNFAEAFTGHVYRPKDYMYATLWEMKFDNIKERKERVKLLQENIFKKFEALLPKVIETMR